MKDRPNGGALARLGTRHGRERSFQRDAYRGHFEQHGLTTLRCHAAMVMAVCGVALVAVLQRGARIVRSIVGADRAAASALMDEFAMFETHRVANDRQVRDARELPRQRAQRQRTGQAAAG